jgi:hypothetical protein
MISLLIGILIIVVVGAICFWAIEKFAPDKKLANLLRLLVVSRRDCAKTDGVLAARPKALRIYRPPDDALWVRRGPSSTKLITSIPR